MKCALVLENDLDERSRLQKILAWLGYLAAPVRTPDEALKVASAIGFDLIVTTTCTRPNDRRSLTGELKRIAPASAIVFVAGEEEEYQQAKGGRYPCVSAVLKPPVSMEALRRIVQFGVDGFGLHPAGVPRERERRRRFA